MLSVVPGGGGGSNKSSTKQSVKGLFSMIASSLTQPAVPQRSNSGKFKSTGRRLHSAPSSQVPEKKTESARDRPKFTGDASIEELDRMLEDDALQLLNIRKELSVVQKDELEKARATLTAIRKSYDQIFVDNNAKERELQSLLDRHTSLVEIDIATTSTQSAAKNQMGELQEQTTQVLDDLSAEQKTIKMQTLMIKRLEDEIGKCRQDIAKANLTVEHAKHDMSLAETNMQINKQYLLEQELQLDKLNLAYKQRRDQRDSKISMLQTMTIEGETSMNKLQSTIAESDRRALMTANKRKQTAMSKTAAHKTVTAEEEEDFTDAADISTRAKRMTAVQIKEALSRYQSQGTRVERLQQLDQELRSNVSSQQKKKQELSEHLSQTQIKIQQLASNRQIYQEVDLKDSALAATSKEFEESKDRDFRLKLSLEEMRASIPRFLTKVTKIMHPKPSQAQLGDAVLKLEDELTKLIKAIGSALLKDATPDDLAVMSQQSNAATGADAHSDFGRLHRLPGFSRMQRQLFFNMMTAKPDMSDGNVRIANPPRSKKPVGAAGAAGGGVVGREEGGRFGRRGVQIDRSAAMTMNVEDNDDIDEMMQQQSSSSARAAAADAEEPALGRATVKNISKLIVDRDGGKIKSASEDRRRSSQSNSNRR